MMNLLMSNQQTVSKSAIVQQVQQVQPVQQVQQVQQVP